MIWRPNVSASRTPQFQSWRLIVMALPCRLKTRLVTAGHFSGVSPRFIRKGRVAGAWPASNCWPLILSCTPLQLSSRRSSTSNPYFSNRPNSCATTIGAQSASGMNPICRGLLLFKIFNMVGFLSSHGSVANFLKAIVMPSPKKPHKSLLAAGNSLTQHFLLLTSCRILSTLGQGTELADDLYREERSLVLAR